MTDLLAHHRALCDRARALMEAKNADYAGPADPWRNLEAASRLGVGTPEQAIFIRLCDKFSRLATALSGGAHAPISRIARVPAAGTGAIHHKAILQALTSDQMQKHPLGGR